jgi:hypothetical protein
LDNGPEFKSEALERRTREYGRDANRRVALAGGRSPEPASDKPALIEFTQSRLESVKGWRLEAASLALGRDGT